MLKSIRLLIVLRIASSVNRRCILKEPIVLEPVARSAHGNVDAGRVVGNVIVGQVDSRGRAESLDPNGIVGHYRAGYIEYGTVLGSNPGVVCIRIMVTHHGITDRSAAAQQVNSKRPAVDPDVVDRSAVARNVGLPDPDAGIGDARVLDRHLDSAGAGALDAELGEVVDRAVLDMNMLCRKHPDCADTGALSVDRNASDYHHVIWSGIDDDPVDTGCQNSSERPI